MWEREEQAIFASCKKSKNKALAKKLAEEVRHTNEHVKSAIREKWLNYCKALHLSKIMDWRMMLNKGEFSKHQIWQIKRMVSERKYLDEKYLDFYDVDKKKHYDGGPETKKITKDFDRLGPKVDIVFPLLNPDIDWFEDRLEQHKTWWTLAYDENTFLKYGEEPNEALFEKSVREIADMYPTVLSFIPTQRVLKKLIERATRIKVEDG